MVRQIEVPAVPGEAGVTVDLYPVGGQVATESGVAAAEITKPGAYVATVTAVAAEYDCRVFAAGGELLSSVRGELGAADGLYVFPSVAPAAAQVQSSVAAALVDHFETQLRANGGISYLQLLNLLFAALCGNVSLNGSTEDFEFLDGSAAFSSDVVGGERTVTVS